MAQDWNDTTLPWQTWDGTNHPWKNPAMPWNDTSLPWKAIPNGTPTGDGVMDFSLATGDDTGLLVLLEDI